MNLMIGDGFSSILDLCVMNLIFLSLLVVLAMARARQCRHA
jgi:L-cystine uptake protein TcyP (sodium:dicarboxylate symporter family)